MLVIRFLRIGKKNQPSFKIVVANKRRGSVSGRFVEEVGFYNLQTKEKVLKKERIEHWLSQGAKPSNTVHNLLVQEKIIKGKKISVHKKKKEKEKRPEVEATEKAPSVSEKPSEEPQKKAEPKKEPEKEEKTIQEKSESEEKIPEKQEKPEKPKEKEIKKEEVQPKPEKKAEEKNEDKENRYFS